MAERLGEPTTPFGVPPIQRRLKAGTELWRVYFQGGSYPGAWNRFRAFGPTGSRFDHHTTPRRVQGRQILYATNGKNAIATCLAEVFQETRHVDTARDEPWLCCFELAKQVPLLDTSSSWPLRAGGNMAINAGAKSRARRWSRAIYREYGNIQGIWYPSSLTGDPCVALYERALPAMPAVVTLNLPLSHPDLLGDLTVAAARLNFTLS